METNLWLNKHDAHSPSKLTQQYTQQINVRSDSFFFSKKKKDEENNTAVHSQQGPADRHISFSERLQKNAPKQK